MRKVVVLIPTCGRDAAMLDVLAPILQRDLPGVTLLAWDDPDNPTPIVEGSRIKLCKGRAKRGGQLRGLEVALECAEVALSAAADVIIRMDSDVAADAEVLRWLAETQGWRYIERPGPETMRGMLWAADHDGWSRLHKSLQLKMPTTLMRQRLMSEIHADALMEAGIAHETLPEESLAHVKYHNPEVVEAKVYHCGLRQTMDPLPHRLRSEWVARTMSVIDQGERTLPLPTLPWWWTQQPLDLKPKTR